MELMTRREISSNHGRSLKARAVKEREEWRSYLVRSDLRGIRRPARGYGCDDL